MKARGKIRKTKEGRDKCGKAEKDGGKEGWRERSEKKKINETGKRGDEQRKTPGKGEEKRG